jgi:hypothetical protein
MKEIMNETEVTYTLELVCHKPITWCPKPITYDL